MQNTLKISHWNSPKPTFVRLERTARVPVFKRDRKGRFSKKWHQYISNYWWGNIALVLLLPGLWSLGFLLEARHTQKAIASEVTHERYMAYLERECAYGKSHPEKYTNISELRAECKKNNIK